MQIIFTSVTADSVMQANKSPEVVQHMKLINAQMTYEDSLLFDLVVFPTDDFTITKTADGNKDKIRLTLSKLGFIELNVNEYRDLMIM